MLIMYIGFHNAMCRFDLFTIILGVGGLLKVRHLVIKICLNYRKFVK